MNDLTVSTYDGEIVLEAGETQQWAMITITADQVDTVVGWLLEAKAELEGKKRN